MTSIKNEDGDVDDNNASEAEAHQHSSKSNGAPDRDFTDDESTDSDDLSEMDEKECKRRRIECIVNITHLEKQFLMFREQFYHEQINQVHKEITEIHNGRSTEYLRSLQRLRYNMNSRIEEAGVLRRLRLQNIFHKYKSEELAARQNFENEKQLTKDSIYDEIIEKICRLEENRSNVNISSPNFGTSTRKSRSPGRKKAVTVSGPYIVYKLAEKDILEDLKIIRQALLRSGTTS